MDSRTSPSLASLNNVSNSPHDLSLTTNLLSNLQIQDQSETVNQTLTHTQTPSQDSAQKLPRRGRPKKSEEDRKQYQRDYYQKNKNGGNVVRELENFLGRDINPQQLIQLINDKDIKISQLEHDITTLKARITELQSINQQLLTQIDQLQSKNVASVMSPSRFSVVTDQLQTPLSQLKEDLLNKFSVQENYIKLIYQYLSSLQSQSVPSQQPILNNTSQGFITNPSIPSVTLTNAPPLNQTTLNNTFQYTKKF
jgi:uncharacterized protein (DUF3084 family)